MGLFGGSKSKRTTINEDNRVINEYVTHNDGEFAGVTGSVSLDESDHSVEDSNNSHYEDNSDHSVENDIDRSIEDSYNQHSEDNSDNSIENDIDNSVRMEYDGDFAGNSGTLTITDGGAIESAQAVAEYALDTAGNIAADSASLVSQALDVNESIVAESFNFGEALAEGAFNLGGDVVAGIEHLATDAVNVVTEFTENTIDSVGDDFVTLSSEFANSLGSTSNDIIQSNLEVSEAILDKQSQTNSDDKAIIAELAKNTSLAGQDIVAKSSENMVKYMSFALGGMGLMIGMGLLMGGRK